MAFQVVNAPLRGRGSSIGLTDIFSTNSQASCWAWMDKGQGPTMAMSSFYEHTSAATVTRRVGDQVQEIPAPRALRAYNVHMAGVDVNSQLGQGSMTCRQKTNKWRV